MPKGIKLALPGYNATTDTDPNHFSLYVDQSVDYILIKEKTPGNISIAANTSTPIAHGLIYIPFCLVFAQWSAGVWRKLFSTPLDGSGLSFTIDGTNLTLINSTGSAVIFAYHIFYDNIT